MRGRQEPQVTMLAFVDMEERVPADHPLRAIKALADEALTRLSPEFDRMYADVGRPSIPPERLLKASLLIGLFSVRSERAFCEELDYNLLFRWFLGMQLMERSFDATVFTKNRQRLLEALTRLSPEFDRMYADVARAAGLARGWMLQACRCRLPSAPRPTRSCLRCPAARTTSAVHRHSRGGSSATRERSI